MTTPSKAPAPADAGDSRARILEAAERLMAERGFAATSITAISRASGLPASSIYWHFESKAGLLAAVIEAGADRWLQRLRQHEAGPGDAGHPLRAFFAHGYGELSRRPPEFLRLAMLIGLERSSHDPQTLEAIRNARERGRSLMREQLSAAFAHAGPVAEEIAGELADFAMCFVQGCFVAHQIVPDEVDLERLAEQLDVALMALGESLLAERAAR